MQIHVAMCQEQQKDILFKKRKQILLDHDVCDEYVSLTFSQLVAEDFLKQELVFQFRKLYSEKLFDDGHLYNIAFPSKVNKVQTPCYIDFNQEVKNKYLTYQK